MTGRHARALVLGTVHAYYVYQFHVYGRSPDRYVDRYIYIYVYAEVMMYEWACHYLWVALYSAWIGLVVA